MMLRDKLIHVLADGEIHSGAALARVLNCSRTAVWKHVHELEKFGLHVEARAGRGYRLVHPIELLSEKEIVTALSPRARDDLEALHVFSSIDSTSEFLRTAAQPPAGKISAALAEFQQSGRGRRGRSWQSPFGSGICLSVAKRLESVPEALSSLSLALGVGLCRALEPLAPGKIGLKWPNDLVAEQGKLAGLLVDVQGESDGPILVVAGVGLNIDIGEDLKKAVAATGGVRPIGLRQLASSEISRNELAGTLISSLAETLREFELSGLNGFSVDWPRFDQLADCPVVIRHGAQQLLGTARGIDERGQLRLERAGQIESIVAGEVSLRAQTRNAD